MRRILIITGILLTILLITSVMLQAELPAPTGSDAVGRAIMHWTDSARAEPLTEAADDHREVTAHIWYPAQAGTGTSTPYFPDLAAIADGLRESGEVSAIELAALPLLRSHERLDAAISDASSLYPVIILSPGNGTNVEFFAALADDLASHGYVVVGINHPFDVAAVVLSDGEIAHFMQGPQAFEANRLHLVGRVSERAADVRFVLDQLEALNQDDASPFAGHLDLNNVAAMGHSIGGLAAVEACANDARFDACVNIDGLQQGGPFGVTADAALPTQPFMFLTKEASLPQPITQMFQALTSDSYKVVVKGASHDSFTDSRVLIPSLLPLPNQADRLMGLTREYVRAFMDQTLKGTTSPLLVEAEEDAVSVEVYQ